jgi:hypothetical protein
MQHSGQYEDYKILFAAHSTNSRWLIILWGRKQKNQEAYNAES